MTKTQAQIVELIAQLPLAERRELIEHVQATGLLEESFYSGMTPEQRAQLEDGIAQAEKGEVVRWQRSLRPSCQTLQIRAAERPLPLEGGGRRAMS